MNARVFIVVAVILLFKNAETPGAFLRHQVGRRRPKSTRCGAPSAPDRSCPPGRPASSARASARCATRRTLAPLRRRCRGASSRRSMASKSAHTSSTLSCSSSGARRAACPRRRSAAPPCRAAGSSRSSGPSCAGAGASPPQSWSSCSACSGCGPPSPPPTRGSRSRPRAAGWGRPDRATTCCLTPAPPAPP